MTRSVGSAQRPVGADRACVDVRVPVDTRRRRRHCRRASPWPGGWRTHLSSSRGPARVTSASRSDRGGTLRPRVGSARPALHTRAGEASDSPGAAGAKGCRAGGGCRPQRFILSAWRPRAWPQGQALPAPRAALAVLVLLLSGCVPATPASIVPSWTEETGRLQSMRSLPVGKVSVLRPPCSQRTLITRGGAITSSKASFPKIATCVVPGVKT